ncbi:MAG: site-specific DNA-methyltransferase [Gammaproteobacteria bacterium]|nr:site-specific DNA-methyltransferase [Gammaproteobacteria bacterium]MDA8007013.1 site-specific DNA-methyltransferase [Gammaproteobacteria bacterium]
MSGALFIPRPKAPDTDDCESAALCDMRHADCLVGLEELRAESVHFVATDPPYFLDGLDDEWNKSKLHKRVKPGVIGGLPAGMKFDRKQAKRLQSFMFKVAGELRRVLKPGGFAAVFCQARLSYAVGAAFDEAGFEIRDMLAWKYEGQAKAFSQEHFVRKMKISEEQKDQIIREISGKKTPQLKPQFEPIILAQKPREGTFINNWLKHRTGLISPEQSIMGGGFPGTILEAPKPKKAGEFGHMTVKPVEVMRQLIGLFSIKGQTVLDPFMGSGTTAVAAVRDRRKFVGFEIDADYIKVAMQRVRDEQELF